MSSRRSPAREMPGLYYSSSASGRDHADHAHDLRSASRRSLILALVLISGFMIAEVIGGILSGSLALLADAAHMVTDAAGIALALLAVLVAGRPASIERTFGYHRTEVLASMFNALSLWAVAAYVFYEAYERLVNHHAIDINGPIMLSVGGVGLLVNILAAKVLHSSAEHSLNVEGALKHVMVDLMGSVGVVIAGILIVIFGPSWNIVDPILSILLGILILWSTWGLINKVFTVLLEGVPDHIDVHALCLDIEQQPGVTLIHDVHVWTITSGFDSMTAHVLMDPDHEGDVNDTLLKIQAIAYGKYNIQHVTVQFDKSASTCQKEDHHLNHLMEWSDKTRQKKFLFIPLPF